MNKQEVKTLIAEYKKKARAKYRALKMSVKKRRGLPLGERYTLWKKDRASEKRWKQRVKAVQDPIEKKAQKRGYKLYQRLRHRKFVIAGWAALLIGVVSLMGGWYYAATRPITDEQQVARDASLVLAREVMDEGMILLRNEDSALPLDTTKVSVFGAGAAAPVYGGGGAGGIASKDVDSLFLAFDEAGIDFNLPLYNVYSNYAFNGAASTSDFTPKGPSLLDVLVPNIAGFLAGATPEMPLDQLPDDVLSQAADYSDTAVYVVSRVGTETQDLTVEELRLSQDERDMLDVLDDNFERVVLLLNTTNAMELGFVEEYENIDAVLWIGGPGEVGTHSVAAALKGEVNPSGHLTDTYAYDLNSNPAVINTGDFQYVDENGDPAGRYFVNEQEGIYVGYRYYETFIDEDEYDEVVQYPFGYGLSYTDFEWELDSTVTNGAVVRANVVVTNTGDVAGKDVVQLYYEPPYTAGGIEKSAIVLGDYAKTSLLQPGQSQTVAVEFAVEDMASYDDQRQKTWVVEAGEYGFVVGRDVHTPVATFDYTQDEQLVLFQDAITGATVTNRFDGVDGDLTYLSRNNAEGTFPVAPTGDALLLPEGLLEADYVHEVVDGLAEPTTNADNGLQLADLKGLDIDDPTWQIFLDQFTTDELIELAGNGGYWSAEINRLGIPGTSMYDGPASIRSFTQAWSSVAYPIPGNLSASWNEDLAERVGRAMGNEAQTFDVDAVYAPSVNLHRSPLSGRNFEYYSEDPLIAGDFGAAWTRGLQSTKTIAVMKHFAANDQETNRANYGLYTWMTEQALREIYLRPFELTVKDGGAMGAMSASNRIGAVWAGGSEPLLTDVLRTEWGFEGFVITDAGIGPQGEHFDALQATEAGNDLMLAFLFDLPGDNAFESQLRDYLKEDRAGTIAALRNAAHNISYYVLHTSEMDD